jgi:hypothetical protein
MDFFIFTTCWDHDFTRTSSTVHMWQEAGPLNANFMGIYNIRGRIRALYSGPDTFIIFFEHKKNRILLQVASYNLGPV